MKTFVSIFIFLVSFTILSAASEYEGYWMLQNGKVIIKLEREHDNKYSGHVVWLKMRYYPENDKEAGVEQYDRKNKNPELRKRKILGLKVVENMIEIEGKLQGGRVYDSWNGKEYNGSARLEDDNTMILRGSYDKYGIFGVSQKIYRVTELSKYELPESGDNIR